MTRHFVIPDRQAKKGVPLDHNKWLGQAIAEYRPDVLIDLGDNADFPSVSTHSAVGSMDKEGQRLIHDIEVAKEADRIMFEHMGKFRPKRMIRLRGNHEHRLTRYIESNPVLEGIVGLHLLGDDDWEIVPFNNGAPGIITVDGIKYAHYFAGVNNGKPLSGTASNMLTQIGDTYIQGHRQGYDIGTKQFATGRVIRGIITGSFYVHDEPYKGNANTHDRKCVVLNEVANGNFCEMPLSLDYLCRKFEGMSLARYLQRRYRNAKQRFSVAA